MTFSAAFLRVDGFTDRAEGGYANHALDRGRGTRYGISSAAHPEVDLETLTPEGAREIRHRCYWLPIRGDELPWPASLSLYDWCIHSADPRFASWVEKDFQKLIGAKPDGDIGAETIKAVNVYCAQHGARALAKHLLRLRTDAWDRGFKLGLFAPSTIDGIEYRPGNPIRVAAGMWCHRGFMNRALDLMAELHTEV